MAETLSAKIKSTGCRLLVTTCPSSFDALKVDYAAMGVDLDGIEVLHATQYLDRLVTEGRLVLENQLDRTAAVLDSDRLGRFNGIYDEPRRLVQAIPGAELKEMSWTVLRADGSDTDSRFVVGGGGGDPDLRRPRFLAQPP